MLHNIDNKIESVIDKLGRHYYILIAFNIIYFASLAGVVFINVTYINYFKNSIHILLCLILIYRFNPLRKNIVLKEYDQILIFSTSVFLLFNMGVAEYIKSYLVKNAEINM
jgi:hypothetical protein